MYKYCLIRDKPKRWKSKFEQAVISLSCHSNVELDSCVKVAGQFDLQSQGVKADVREINEGRGYRIFKLASIVLPNVENERSEGKVGDIHLVTDQEFRLATRKLIFNDGQELF